MGMTGSGLLTDGILGGPWSEARFRVFVSSSSFLATCYKSNVKLCSAYLRLCRPCALIYQSLGTISFASCLKTLRSMCITQWHHVPTGLTLYEMFKFILIPSFAAVNPKPSFDIFNFLYWGRSFSE